MRLVLDTNVWIDWLVFNDPSIGPLKAAQQSGGLHILADEVCLEELKAVLAYPELKLDESRRKNHLAQVDRYVVRYGHQRSACPVALPRCSDPDDQKFLELACNARADWLITRDKALLKLNRRLKAAGFRIGSPSEWSAASTLAG